MSFAGERGGATLNWRPVWLQQERRTARLVRACYKRVRAHGPLDTDELHALCKLTWITKFHGEVIDHARSVLVPALSVLLDLGLSATNTDGLVHELRTLHAPTEIVDLVQQGVGIVNFYNGFRKSSLAWIDDNLVEVREIVECVANARTDQEVQSAYGRVDALPLLPRPGGGDMRCDNLLTPTLACLDPRRRSPIINGREEGRGRLSILGLSGATLEEQCSGLQGLIGQAGLDDAFAIDTADFDTITEALAAVESSDELPPAEFDEGPAFVELAERGDDDVEYFRMSNPVQMKHLHNTMTNALRDICGRAKLRVEEGTDKSCLFDALIREYLGTERHLLVEVKTDVSAPFCRLAVGQLHDYRRKLPEAAAIDLAVLLPSKPPQDMLDFLGYVGVRALWLSKTAKHIEGDVPIGGK